VGARKVAVAAHGGTAGRTRHRAAGGDRRGFGGFRGAGRVGLWFADGHGERRRGERPRRPGGRGAATTRRAWRAGSWGHGRWRSRRTAERRDGHGTGRRVGIVEGSAGSVAGRVGLWFADGHGERGRGERPRRPGGRGAATTRRAWRAGSWGHGRWRSRRTAERRDGHGTGRLVGIVGGSAGSVAGRVGLWFGDGNGNKKGAVRARPGRRLMLLSIYSSRRNLKPTDFGRVMAVPTARFQTSWLSMPIARETLKSTV
jgi:hypothetical protein